MAEFESGRISLFRYVLMLLLAKEVWRSNTTWLKWFYIFFFVIAAIPFIFYVGLVILLIAGAK